MMEFTLKIYSNDIAVYRLPDLSGLSFPEDCGFFNLSVTGDEISLMCDVQRLSPEYQRWLDRKATSVSKDWFCLRVNGDLPFDIVGVIATLTGHIASIGISQFAVCTHDRDYVLVPNMQRHQVISHLKAVGYRFADCDPV
ncbi:ACT domain-containing protein [Vibrio spartinae]|nr:ACT domain-containing protein [Vibrio spartinae]